jgi:hypothetical protein
VCVCVSPIVAKQRLSKIPLSLLGNGSVKTPLSLLEQRVGRNVAAVTNTHSTIKELLDVSFAMWPVSYQGKSAISSSQNLFYYPTERGFHCNKSTRARGTMFPTPLM